MEIENLSELEIKWLRTRGGRTNSDVYEGKGRKYVIMIDRNGIDTKVYIPDNKELHKLFNIKKDGTERKKILS